MIKHQGVKIFISLVIAFLIVNFYNRLLNGPFISPAQAENIKMFFSNLKFPSVKLKKIFTLNINPSNNENNQQSNNENFSFNLPTAPIKPTQINYFQPSLSPTKTQTPTSTFTKNSFSITDYPPTLTSAPKPTKKPKPTPIPARPAITTEVRPGSTLKEIYEEIEKRMCVPAALLYAFQQAETGAWWPINTASSKVKIYNKYGWWLDGSGNSCTGMGYHTQTGIVPNDAVDAGVKCQNPIPSGADQAIMGLWQISKYEEDAAKKYLTKIIKGKIDRRVIFDNALIFAVITKNRLGSPPKNCSDWPTDAIKTAAEKHYGSCGDNYCNKVLNYYKEYKH